MAQDPIDLQFDRAVEIVQGLPKTGPIQTGYEEKLAMYSLYKQATVGNVTGSRPGIWDMLGRAKWDAWAKQKDLDPRQAKWMYVETLMKVLRKYSDRTVARDLVKELDSYGGDSGVLSSSSFGRTRSDSESTGSESSQPRHIMQTNHTAEEGEDDYSSEEDEKEVDQATHTQAPRTTVSEVTRPQSSMSSQMRYRTPAAGSMIGGMSTGMPPGNVPVMQPLPEYATPSAFASSGSPIPSSSYPASAATYPQPLITMSPGSGSPRPVYGPYAPSPSFQRSFAPGGSASGIRTRSDGATSTRPPLERAMESMQASLAALHERLERLEVSYPINNATSSFQVDNRRWSSALRGSTASPHNHPPNDSWEFDPANMGAWSLLLQPLTRLNRKLKGGIQFLLQNDERSPLLTVLRRLILDASFIFFVLFVLQIFWRRTGARRRELYLALSEVWRVLTGNKRARNLVDKGV